MSSTYVKPPLQTQGRPRDRTSHLPPGDFDCCGDHNPYDIVIACEGPTHTRARWLHSACIGDPDPALTYLCDRCSGDDSSSSPLPPSSLVDSSDLGDGSDSESDADDEFADNPIVDQRWNEKRKCWDYWVAPAHSKLERWTHEYNLDQAVVDAWKDQLAVKDSEDEDSEDDDGVAAPVGAPTLTCDLDDRIHNESQNPLWPKLKDGYWSIAMATYDEVRREKATADIPSLDVWHQICNSILGGTPFSVLVAILGAGLYRTKQAVPEVRAELKKLRRKANGRPCVYLLELTDQEGLGPTVGEMRRMINLARRYENPTDPSDVDLAVQVDSVKAELDADEAKARDDPEERRYLNNQNQRRTLNTMLDNLEDQLDKLGLVDSARVPFLLNDVGYTDSADRRIDGEHLQHYNSNVLMNLIEAIFIVEGARYRIRGDVIFLCFQELHAKHGEVFWSIVCQTYTWTGQGFNGRPAGLNLKGLDKYASEWSSFAAQSAEEGPYYDNLKQEAQRIARYQTLCNQTELDIRIQEALMLEDEIAEEEEHARLMDEYTALAADLNE